MPAMQRHRGHRAPRQKPKHAPVAQLDRAPDYESGGQEFESLRARHSVGCQTGLDRRQSDYRVSTAARGDFLCITSTPATDSSALMFAAGIRAENIPGTRLLISVTFAAFIALWSRSSETPGNGSI